MKNETNPTKKLIYFWSWTKNKIEWWRFIYLRGIFFHNMAILCRRNNESRFDSDKTLNFDICNGWYFCETTSLNEKELVFFFFIFSSSLANLLTFWQVLIGMKNPISPKFHAKPFVFLKMLICQIVLLQTFGVKLQKCYCKLCCQIRTIPEKHFVSMKENTFRVFWN